jgi:aspartate/methionine/tyrosine aminotransferase
MLSHRVPRDREPNAWSRRLDQLRRSGGQIFDLTEANPTRVGLRVLGPEAAERLASAFAGVATSSYAPDPRGMSGAREAIARYYEDRGLAVDPAHLVLTAGTSEAYAHLFRLLSDPGETVLVPAPSYPLFEPIAAVEGVRVTPYAHDEHAQWRPDLDGIEARLAEGARAVIVVQPNHPTGTCVDPATIDALDRLCARSGAAIIADEVFGDFAWDPREGGLPSFVGERRALTFVLSGLSKVCGLPQMKLGWIWTGGSPAFRDEALEGLEWISDLFLTVASPVQDALAALLEGRHEFQRRALERIAINRARLARAVGRVPSLGAPAGEGGWVAVLGLPPSRDEEAWALDALERGVVVHPGHFYDFPRDGFAVISLIVEPERFDAALTRIEQIARS